MQRKLPVTVHNRPMLGQHIASGTAGSKK